MSMEGADSARGGNKMGLTNLDLLTDVQRRAQVIEYLQTLAEMAAHAVKPNSVEGKTAMTAWHWLREQAEADAPLWR